MYSIASFGAMIVDGVRTDAYAEALREAIGPDSVVVDIGAGTGIFSLLACQYGARHVYAIEPNDAIQVARDIARANGFGERITFCQEISTKVNLPERADIVVSDLHGVLPLFKEVIPTIIDARRRMLKAGGTLIPRRDTLFVGLVEAPDLYRAQEEPWRVNAYGLNMTAARALVSSTWRAVPLQPEHLLAPGQPWFTLDYETVTQPNARGTVTWEVPRDGTGHGLGMWFDADLADGIGYSGAPGEPNLVYGRAFFPFAEAVALGAGDVVTVELAANLVRGDYAWRWNTTVTAAGDERRVKATFRQSTAFGFPLTLEKLHKGEASYVPRLGLAGEVDRMILGLMDGQTALADIAGPVLAAFPGYFRDENAALTRVAELALRYG